MAGLSLALQLRQRFADLDIVVLERRAHPAPEAAHKVGESTVEIGAHYFAEVLGLKEHLRERQLKKFGFRFFFNDGRGDIDGVTELGASRPLATPAWQIDRGIFENALGRLALERGIRFQDQALVRSIELADGAVRDSLHTVRYERGGQAQELRARWLVDACGRAGLLKRKLGLAEPNGHEANAVWFRIQDRLDVNDWSGDAQWLARCDPPHRWLSTNHLCGDGYWAWLIPLASGSHSVGIVCDARMHPIEGMNSFERAMEWLARHQPRLHAELDARRDRLQDFAFFRNFSYGCRQVFDGQARWALTGEAGVFLDPFYSPGSDFIAIANGFITELVAHDRAGKPAAMYADIYQSVFFSLYRNMLPIYTGQYRLFGNAQVMPVKVLWDYTYYWGVMCPLYFQGKLTDVTAMGRLQQPLAAVQKLGIAMQDFLRAWDAAGRAPDRARMLDQAALPWFAELNRGLTDPLDDAGFRQRLQQGLELLDVLALQITAYARASHPQLDDSAVRASLSDPARAAAADPGRLLFPQMQAECA
ncbi:Candidate Halogenase [Ramlibacter tataouinensis TTB310]|uniref:Candidate Halogenase n=1 Tax=Ramlibacter tataouinensis (strain ATCC BAA-407 / DSM 14655 / LMG 21543 / TTB310) TaxID=365046 RepID=F5Y4J8_RAMTT|nr:Candidate Halogenase [Ramlibacter tataouinensis TTB310]